MSQVFIRPIGHIETPYKTLVDCPRNISEDGPECTLVIDKQFHDALMGLKIGQRILILYWFASSNRDSLQQKSRRNDRLAGVFALRTPNRPNPIGAAVLTIQSVRDGRITVNGLDCLNKTLLIDIKPAMTNEQDI